ncbi:hypothetical protein [Methylobacterium sp. Leaf469]|uniref:hypothetical protein n=1 Tax=Methylobacterium sp. Leaf469 TaxID=1736387 RepID=UPI000A4C3944|nr:hypothetical protein [Methylobacterium sp. Leaf469]
MRYIKQSDLLKHVSDQWKQDAATALEALKILDVASRAKFIGDRGTIWSELKTHMASLSHDKCWYSEKRIAVSELEVDHWRPKNRVTGVRPPHKGYWWLAFDWKNFRLAYSLINKRRTDARTKSVQGKGCRFPLIDEKARVPDVASASIAGESPKLIDPCIASDVLLLDYAVEDGLVVERHKKTENEKKFERAKVSIDLFHLNEGNLILDRHALYVAIDHWARQIEDLEKQRASDNWTVKQEADYEELINRVGDHINAAAPFSAFTRACLKQKGDLGWNTQLLTTA